MKVVDPKCREVLQVGYERDLLQNSNTEGKNHGGNKQQLTLTMNRQETKETAGLKYTGRTIKELRAGVQRDSMRYRWRQSP